MTSYAYKLNELLRYEVIKGQQEAIESKYFRNFRELGEQVKKSFTAFQNPYYKKILELMIWKYI